MSKSKNRKFWHEGEEGSEKKKKWNVLKREEVKREKDRLRSEIQKAVNGELDVDDEGESLLNLVFDEGGD